eukprot:12287409-Karenia_brevis.AAC.1
MLAQGYVNVCGSPVKVLKYDESTEYLGRLVCFSALHDTEIRHRTTKGWAAFGKLREELCDHHYPLYDRLRLFNAVVS